MTDPQTGTGRIVVGVDGSAGSRTALGWACAQAALTSATVEAVITWQEPMMYGATSLGYAPVALETVDTAKIMATLLNDTVEAVATTAIATDAVVRRVIQGHPVQVLLDMAEGADLLVVGSRGHGSFAGLLLGSVSQHCVQHAPSPVVVVPA